MQACHKAPALVTVVHHLESVKRLWIKGAEGGLVRNAPQMYPKSPTNVPQMCTLCRPYQKVLLWFKLLHMQNVEKEGALAFDMMQDLPTFPFLACPIKAKAGQKYRCTPQPSEDWQQEEGEGR